MAASYWAANRYKANRTSKAKRITWSANKHCQCLIPKMYCTIGTHPTVPLYPLVCSQIHGEENAILPNVICTIHRHQNRALNSADLFKCELMWRGFCLVGLHWCNKSFSSVLILICYLVISSRLLCFFHLLVNPPSCINPQNMHGHFLKLLSCIKGGGWCRLRGGQTVTTWLSSSLQDCVWQPGDTCDCGSHWPRRILCLYACGCIVCKFASDQFEVSLHAF